MDVRVKVVTFDEDFMALAYIKETRLPWPLLQDADQQLYAAYRMTSGSWWSIYGLPSVIRYPGLMFRGRMPGKPGRDWASAKSQA